MNIEDKIEDLSYMTGVLNTMARSGALDLCYTNHCTERMKERNITVSDIRFVLKCGIIESYLGPERLKMQQIYHYTESGLDNVYLHNINIVHDSKGEEVVYIPKVNQLHQVIAQGIINKAGIINGKELRFLRTEIGLKQAELSSQLGKEAQAVGRWERGECPIDKTTDTLIRIIAAAFLGLKIDLTEIPALHQKQAANDNINIDGTDENYQLMAA